MNTEECGGGLGVQRPQPQTYGEIRAQSLSIKHHCYLQTHKHTHAQTTKMVPDLEDLTYKEID